MNFLSHLIPIVALSLLCAAWLAIQFLAKKMGTKNHFDHAKHTCGNCGCQGLSCTKDGHK